MFSRVETGETVDMDADVLVVCDRGDCDPPLFKCLNDAEIVYDGHVVIDAAFRTNDPDVYATGDIAKFSRRYASEGGRLQPLDRHDPKESGFLLADSLIDRVRGLPARGTPPAFNAPKCESVILPGKCQFLFVAKPARFERPSWDAPAGGRVVETRSDERGYARIDIDANGIVSAFYYCGDAKVDAQRMGCIVGLPVAYLGEELSSAACLLTHLDRDEFAAVFHDGVRSAASQRHDAPVGAQRRAGGEFPGCSKRRGDRAGGHHRLRQAARVGPAPVGHPVDGFIADSYEKSASTACDDCLFRFVMEPHNLY